MEFKKTLLCLSLVATLSPALVHAEQPSYNFVDAGYLKIDLDDISLDPTGMFVKGSIEISENWFIEGGYLNADDSSGLVEVDADQFNFGGGFKTALSENTSFHLVLDYLSAEVEARNFMGGSVSEDEDGYAVSVGIRSMVADRFELNAGAAYADLGEEDGLDFSVGTAWYLTKNLGIILEANFDDDSNRQYIIGGRLSF